MCFRPTPQARVVRIHVRAHETSFHFPGGRRLALSLLLAGGKPAAAQDLSSVPAAKAKEIAIDAYTYGYSLITTEVTRVQMSNVAKADELRAPMGQFTNVKRYPPGNYRGVSAPNADTLYSLAWIDVGKEPTVFSHPDMGKRFYLFPMYSLWMPVVESPGSRTAGEKAGTYLITGPGWSGTVPAGMTQIKSPTRYMVILGRTYADGSREGLQGGQCAAGAVQARAAQRLRQEGLQIRRPAGRSQSRLQHDRQAAGGHRCDGHLGLFQHDDAADGLRHRPAGRRGRADHRAPCQDRHRARPEVRHHQALAGRPGGAQGCRQGGLRPRSSPRRAASGTLQNGWRIPGRGRHLWHRLSRPRAGGGVRLAGEPAGGRGLSLCRDRRRRPEAGWAPTSTP